LKISFEEFFKTFFFLERYFSQRHRSSFVNKGTAKELTPKNNRRKHGQKKKIDERKRREISCFPRLFLEETKKNEKG
jgi:hypothetical protein